MASADIVHVDSSNLASVTGAKAALLDFTATWCGPCQMLAPILDKLSAEFKGKVTIAKCDIDENGDIAGEYGVMAVPTLLFIKDGKVVDQHAGLLPEGVLRQRLSALSA